MDSVTSVVTVPYRTLLDSPLSLTSEIGKVYCNRTILLLINYQRRPLALIHPRWVS